MTELVMTLSEDEAVHSSSESTAENEQFCFEFEPDGLEHRLQQGSGPFGSSKGSYYEKGSLNAFDEILMRHKNELASEFKDESTSSDSESEIEEFEPNGSKEPAASLEDGSDGSDMGLGDSSEESADKCSSSGESSLGDSGLRDISLKYKNSKVSQLMDKSKRVEFERFHLSRPILKGLTRLNFLYATPVQLRCIPLILEGKDLFASAVTGSGKTAAFAIPILERLLFRQSFGYTRVLVLMPTRELADQCHSVIEKLALYTNDITVALITGGVPLKGQEQVLCKNPDIVVATPGRIIDHLLNTVGFSLEKIDVLVLDEADRLLELGFIDQLNRIVRECPSSRQTLLFSATMTENVEELARDSLRSPEKVILDPLYQVSDGLVQEFVRVRNVKDREAMLLCLLRKFRSRVLIFCTHKTQVHRLKVLMTLLNFRVAEFHGDMAQTQRFEVLKKFCNQEVDYLVASDVAARGLDIAGIETVINYELPMQITAYVHRVGRTARAGHEGRAVSLVLESDYKLFKKIVKSTSGALFQRNIPAERIKKWSERVALLNPEIENIAQEEKVEREIERTEMLANKAQNVIEHAGDIKRRPEKVWFQTNSQKKKTAQAQVAQVKKEKIEAKKACKESKVDKAPLTPEKPSKKENHKKRARHQKTKASSFETDKKSHKDIKPAAAVSKTKNPKRAKIQSKVLGGRRESRPTKSIFNRIGSNRRPNTNKKAFKSRKRYKRR